LARPTSRRKSEISLKVRELRKLLGDSQQAFSNRFGMALQTIARYEGPQPPTGVALLKLAGMAGQHGHDQLRDFFRAEYLKEIHKALGDAKLTIVDGVGYLFALVDAQEDLILAQLYLQIVRMRRQTPRSEKSKGGPEWIQAEERSPDGTYEVRLTAEVKPTTHKWKKR
jgi:transcriptional regulator with XRE-family HTH domain